MDEVKIRNAKGSDQPMIKGLVKELYDSLVVKDGMDEILTPEKFVEVLGDANTEVLVAEAKSLVVGYLTLNLNKTFLDASITAIIGEFVVSNEYHGQGIGKSLVEAAINRSIEFGCSEIGVGTETSNIKGREFYKACGFSERGVIFDMELTDDH